MQGIGGTEGKVEGCLNRNFSRVDGYVYVGMLVYNEVTW